MTGALLPLAGSVFVASLLGSAHCAGMCGGFVCLYSAQQGTRRIGAHVAYHAGRLTSYATLGVIAGALGVGLDALGIAGGVQRGAAIVAGAAILMWGGFALVRAAGVAIALPVHVRFAVPVAAVMRAVHARPPAQRALVLGLVTTLLPCGWLYLYVATAAGTGSPLAGAAVMAAFWLGTVPVLAGLAWMARRLVEPLRRRLPVLSAATLIVVGLLTIAGKFHAGAQPAAHCGMHSAGSRATAPVAMRGAAHAGIGHGGR